MWRCFAQFVGHRQFDEPGRRSEQSAGRVSGGHHHHHGGKGGGGGLSQIINTVESALQNSSSSSTDPNQVIQNALQQLFGGSGSASGTSGTTDGTDATSNTAEPGQHHSGHDRFVQHQLDRRFVEHRLDRRCRQHAGVVCAVALESFGVDPQQFRSDLISALTASQGGSPNSSALFQSFQPGSGVDAVA